MAHDHRMNPVGEPFRNRPRLNYQSTDPTPSWATAINQGMKDTFTYAKSEKEWAEHDEDPSMYLVNKIDKAMMSDPTIKRIK